MIIYFHLEFNFLSCLFYDLFFSLFFMNVGDLFDILLPMLCIYQEYVRNHHYSLQVLAEYKQKADFNNLLKRYEEKPLCEGRSVEIFLTHPMHQVRILSSHPTTSCALTYAVCYKTQFYESASYVFVFFNQLQYSSSVMNIITCTMKIEIYAMFEICCNKILVFGQMLNLWICCGMMLYNSASDCFCSCLGKIQNIFYTNYFGCFTFRTSNIENIIVKWFLTFCPIYMWNKNYLFFVLIFSEMSLKPLYLYSWRTDNSKTYMAGLTDCPYIYIVDETPLPYKTIKIYWIRIFQIPWWESSQREIFKIFFEVRLVMVFKNTEEGHPFFMPFI